MSTETGTVGTDAESDADSNALNAARPARAVVRRRTDQPLLSLNSTWGRWVRGLGVLVLAVGFVVVGGGSLDLGPIESRLGMAAGEPIGPFGRLYGGWEPSLWPVQVATSRAWYLLASWGEADGGPTAGAVRWPSAIAGVLAGLLLSRRMLRSVGPWASLLLGACWFGSLALIDRSAGAGIDMIVGLGTVAALDRILGRGSDVVAGLWASLAFLAGGWPPLAVIALSTVVIGRSGAGLRPALVLPALATVVAWSAWALSRAQAEAWAAALALPLTEKSAWTLALGVFALGLPWSPLALLVAGRSVRDGWTGPARSLVLGWLQVAGACLLVGSVVPGLAPAARMPALAGLAVVAAACADRVRAGTVSVAARRGFLTLGGAVVVAWIALVVVSGIFLASAVPYYRGVAIVLIVVSLLTGLVGLSALIQGDARRGLVALTAVAVCLKIAHWGYYVPEWNYRQGQGPWGRAIGQWVVPGWPIYTLHTWPADLAFATEHPFRQLSHPKSLAHQAGPNPKFVLLLASEYEHWPAIAPPLVPVANFQDQRGSSRVLARTAGPFSWKALAQSRRKHEDLAR